MPAWRRKIRRGGILILSGVFVGTLPLIVALIEGVVSGYSPFSEGSGSGAVLWLLVFTLPIGFIISVIGVVLLVSGFVRYRGALEQE